ISTPLLLGRWSVLAALGIALATWIGTAVIIGVVQRVRATRGGLLKQPRSWLGMHLAHLGVAVFVAGVTLVTAYETEQDLPMDPGETVQVGRYELTFEGVSTAPGPNYEAEVGNFLLSRNGKVLRSLHPEKRDYFSSDMPMPEAAIDANGLRPVYVSLGEALGDRAWSVRVYLKPFVDWIWLGTILMALGGVLAISDRRYRLKRRARRAKAPMAGAAS